MGFETDDIVVHVESSSGLQAKMIGQIKSSIRFNNSNVDFKNMIRDAWLDFNNKNVFHEEADVIALLCGPLTETDTSNVRPLLEHARQAENATDFHIKPMSKKQKEKLEIFKTALDEANGSDVGEDELWRFLKSFYVLIYDLDIEGIVLSLLKTLIYNDANVIWARIVENVTYRNFGGQITIDNIPDDIREAFTKKPAHIIPQEFLPPRATTPPNWNLSDRGNTLANLSLLGSWDERMEYDREVVTQITKANYELLKLELRNILQEEDTPLAVTGSIWRIKDHRNLWDSLASRFLDDDLDNLQKQITAVLSEKDEKLTSQRELDSWSAAFYYSNFATSANLRNGLANSLVYIGCYYEKLINCTSNKAESFACLCIREIFNKSDWILWRSIDSLLPHMAEADPKEYMIAIENDLDRESESSFYVFESLEGKNSGIGTNLYRSLEIIAWEEEHLTSAAILLCRLARFNSSGDRNKAIASLTSIFLPWLPQTKAPFERQAITISAIVREFPDIAWELLISLMPNKVQTAFGTSKPKYRNPLADDWKQPVLKVEYWNQITLYAKHIIDLAKGDHTRLASLIKNLDNLIKDALEDAIIYFSESADNFTEDEKAIIWSELTLFIKRHESFPDADWSFDDETLKRLNDVNLGLKPRSPSNYHRILFKEGKWDLYEGRYSDGYHKREEWFQNQCESALKEIICEEGLEALTEFVNNVDHPYEVGRTLVGISDSSIDAFVLPNLLASDSVSIKMFAERYVNVKHYKDGWDWVDTLNISQWSKEERLRFALHLSYTNKTWAMIDEHYPEIKTEYWSQMRPDIGYVHSDDTKKAVEELLAHNRPKAAIACFFYQYYDKKDVDKTMLTKALLMGIETDEPEYARDRHAHSELIKLLQGDSSVDSDDMLQIEWGYFKELDGYDGAASKTLEKRLQTDPVFFSEIVKMRFYVETSEFLPYSNEKARTLLYRWRTPPGTHDNANFVYSDFASWMLRVEDLFSDFEHFDAVLYEIGKILFYVPPDKNGFWINKEIASMLNEKKYTDVRDGLFNEAYNSRGARIVDETGQADRDIAEMYRERASETEKEGFRLLAGSLNRIASSYDFDAKRTVERYLHRQHNAIL